MELKVGMYVRTKWGINKINEYVPQTGQLYLKTNVCVKENVIKASHNIIDLIEVGDIVEVEEFSGKNEIKTYNGILSFQQKGFIFRLDRLRIKSIVTKEQFESMSYKVGE